MTAVVRAETEFTGLPAATVRSQVTVPLRFPDGFTATAEVMTFRGLADDKEHLLLALGAWEQSLLGGLPAGGSAPLARLHSECMTGDVFGSERCDCGPQLREAVEEIAAVGGFLLYLRQEGRGIGLYSKLDAYALQDTGLDTYEANLALGHGADERDYTAAAQMLQALGATRVRLLSNNPDKAAQLEAVGIDVTEQVPTGVHLSAANLGYLTAKRDHTGHTLELSQTAFVPSAPGNAGMIPTHADMLQRVDEMVPRLRARAEETERLRRLPDDTVAELKDAGVFQVLAPKAAGGYGMGVESYVEVVRRLARGDASTAWTAGHLMEHVWMLARWPRRVQEEVFANGPAPLAAATSAPVGLARKVPGGYAITGHWSFASGIMHSEWALLAARDGDVRLQCLVPVAGLELLDVWHTDGLRGTGSNDLRANELFVPEYRAMDWSRLSATDNPGSKIHSDPLIHTPMATLLNLIAPTVALGTAEYAIGLFRDRMLVRKEKHAVENRQADSPLAQARFARAHGLIATARLHWQEAVQVVAASQGTPSSPLTEGQKAGYRLSLALSGEAAQAAVRLITAASGGSAHRLSHPLQRIQRDMDVLLSHPTLNADPILEQAGRGLLGLGFTASSF